MKNPNSKSEKFLKRKIRIPDLNACLVCGKHIPADWTLAVKWNDDGTFRGVQHLYDCLNGRFGQRDPGDETDYQETHATIQSNGQD